MEFRVAPGKVLCELLPPDMEVNGFPISLDGNNKWARIIKPSWGGWLHWKSWADWLMYSGSVKPGELTILPMMKGTVVNEHSDQSWIVIPYKDLILCKSDTST